jgi:hypothetical protein
MATRVCKQEKLVEQIAKQNKTTDLLVRLWGWGPELTASEKDVLLAAFDEENKSIRGPIHVRALERLREKGVCFDDCG